MYSLLQFLMLLLHVNTAVMACILLEKLRRVLSGRFSSPCSSDGHVEKSSRWRKQRHHCMVSNAVL